MKRRRSVYKGPLSEEVEGHEDNQRKGPWEDSGHAPSWIALTAYASREWSAFQGKK